MVVVFLFAPLGFIVGFVIGFALSLLNRWPGSAGFARTQGLSILITIAFAGVVSGGFYLAADKPPTIGGKELMLDFELQLPPAIPVPDQPDDSSVRTYLYANGKSGRYAQMDLKAIAQRDGFVVIPGTVYLISQSANCSPPSATNRKELNSLR